MFSSIGLPQPALRFVGTKRPQAKTRRLDQSSRRFIPEVGVPWLPVNSRWTAHSGEVGSRLLAAVKAETAAAQIQVVGDRYPEQMQQMIDR